MLLHFLVLQRKKGTKTREENRAIFNENFKKKKKKKAVISLNQKKKKKKKKKPKKTKKNQKKKKTKNYEHRSFCCKKRWRTFLIAKFSGTHQSNREKNRYPKQPNTHTKRREKKTTQLRFFCYSLTLGFRFSSAGSDSPSTTPSTTLTPSHATTEVPPLGAHLQSLASQNGNSAGSLPSPTSAGRDAGGEQLPKDFGHVCRFAKQKTKKKKKKKTQRGVLRAKTPNAFVLKKWWKNLPKNLFFFYFEKNKTPKFHNFVPFRSIFSTKQYFFSPAIFFVLPVSNFLSLSFF